MSIRLTMSNDGMGPVLSFDGAVNDSAALFLFAVSGATPLDRRAGALAVTAQDKIENITARDNANKLLVLHHRQRADAMLAQQADRFVQWRFRPHHEDIPGHDFFDGDFLGKFVDL